MRKEFETRCLRLNGNKIKAIVPRKEISLEEAIRKSQKILKSAKVF